MHVFRQCQRHQRGDEEQYHWQRDLQRSRSREYSVGKSYGKPWEPDHHFCGAASSHLWRCAFYFERHSIFRSDGRILVNEWAVLYLRNSSANQCPGTLSDPASSTLLTT